MSLPCLESQGFHLIPPLSLSCFLFLLSLLLFFVVVFLCVFFGLVLLLFLSCHFYDNGPISDYKKFSPENIQTLFIMS